jgi:hypothetical protein
MVYRRESLKICRHLVPEPYGPIYKEIFFGICQFLSAPNFPVVLKHIDSLIIFMCGTFLLMLKSTVFWDMMCRLAEVEGIGSAFLRNISTLHPDCMVSHLQR